VAVLFVVLTVLVVAVIGLVSVGGVTQRLERQPPPSFFDSDEALEFIAEHLPDDVTAQLSYDDVRQIMGWYLDYLETKGVAAETEDELIEEQASGTGPIVAEDDEGLAYVLGQASDAGLDSARDLDDVQIVAVVEQLLAYLDAIGAIGSVVDGPVDPR
jgi:hypothetical protein